MIVLDTTVLVDLLDGADPVEEEVEALVRSGEELATTPVNAAELHRGIEAAPEADELAEPAHGLLSLLEILPLDGRAARRFGRLQGELDRRGEPVPVVDGLVAAVALEHGSGRLATQDGGDFERVPGLAVLEWGP